MCTSNSETFSSLNIAYPNYSNLRIQAFSFLQNRLKIITQMLNFYEIFIKLDWNFHNIFQEFLQN